jgi:hypothetical protein
VNIILIEGEHMSTPPSKGKLLYHITHINNIESILKYGLMSRKEAKKRQIKFEDIADHDILSKRDSYKTDLSEYVLFHFYPKNPFDGAVCQKYGSENMAIITIQRKLYKNYKFYIIPSHPLDSDIPNIYPYEEGLEKIKWDILDSDNRDYHNQDVKKACMAECIMQYTIEPKNFFCIYVYNESNKQKIENLCKQLNIKVDVNVINNMFPKTYT